MRFAHTSARNGRAPGPGNAPAARLLLLAAVGAVILALLVVLSLAIGSRPLGAGETVHGLLARDRSVPSIIVWQLRMPRTLLAIGAGAGLAAAGVVMQALTRNPLAEPGILGVNAGAALAVVLSICLLGLTGVTEYLWFAFAGAAAAAGLVHLMAGRSGRAGPTRLVLAGVALGASLGAITGTITMRDTQAFDSYRFWVVGSLEGRGAEVLAWVAPFLLVGLLLAMALGHALNALALGQEQASALGARVGAVRALALVTITLLCGATTAAIGPISFVGLMVPHALRLLLGADQRRILAASLIAGPALLLLADVVGRRLIWPDELEAGVVTAFLGGPVLIGLVLARPRRRA
ncbi:FecCD family ABC transporter permease [Actinomyces gaoshouyii]|uniref:Iron ABC transporter permease n=1 Tax=Actinomyces gaoshouyii TaxID=1960083 RepID=A0A8H9H824_9ACTO|nr:iron chelate uptake ABC transporter family permease subunit [Actinomyces gaoshouyii]ARD42195.1 iron ABC transporter permease [Actinomyces gaoshouyii]GGO96274.1 iron ABC transporter permease [Actinomyces gaoshouyii]